MDLREPVTGRPRQSSAGLAAREPDIALSFGHSDPTYTPFLLYRHGREYVISIVNAYRPQLAIRLPNWLGDVVMALPTILQLQDCGFVLHLAGRSWAKELLAGLNLPMTPLPRGIVAASRVIRTIEMDHALLFTNSLSSALSMRLAGIRTIGYGTDWRSLFLHAALEKLPGRHEVEYFWQLGKAVIDSWAPPGISWPDAPPQQLHLPLLNAHRAAAAKALASADIDGSYTVCCPLAIGTTRGESKMWPLFGEFCKTLAAMGRTIVICPGPGEEPLCEGFQQSAVVLPGISLGVYAALLADAEMVVANDSGPMHMAAAVGAPVVGIFGPGDPSRTSPWGGHYVGGYEGWPDLDAVLSACRQINIREGACT